MELGLQLYGCTALFRRDPEGFMREAARMGYECLEPCIDLVSGGCGADVWQSDEVRGFRGMMARHGLALYSAHLFGDPEPRMEELMSLARDCGIRQYVMGVPGDFTPAFIGGCRRAARTMKAGGVSLLFHNSCDSMARLPDGRSAYEAALQACEGEIGAQVDVGWALYGGEDPVPFMQRLRPYMASVHYKDMKRGYADMAPEETCIALGEGALDVPGIFRFAVSLGLPQLVDQDASDADLMRDLAVSAALLMDLDGH